MKNINLKEDIKYMFHKNKRFIITLIILFTLNIIHSSISFFYKIEDSSLYVSTLITNTAIIIAIFFITFNDNYYIIHKDKFVLYKYTKIFSAIISGVFINGAYDVIKYVININFNIKVLFISITYCLKTSLIYLFIFAGILLIVALKNLFNMYLLVEEKSLKINNINSTDIGNDINKNITVQTFLNIFNKTQYNNIYIKDKKKVININTMSYKYNNALIDRIVVNNDDLYITIKNRK